jgi:RHS repeat-associated protein
LQEVRNGAVRYVPGLALDQPLGLWDGRVLDPSWRGALESSVWTDGTAADQSVGVGTGTLVDWAQRRSVYWTAGPGPTDPSPPDYDWIGNAATGGLQTTGQMYRRNRHYDPLSGQFTQLDPIGLAGGASLFGFAAGDPANFSDPFGLCPPEDADTTNCADDDL